MYHARHIDAPLNMPFIVEAVVKVYLLGPEACCWRGARVNARPRDLHNPLEAIALHRLAQAK